MIKVKSDLFIHAAAGLGSAFAASRTKKTSCYIKYTENLSRDHKETTFMSRSQENEKENILIMHGRLRLLDKNYYTLLKSFTVLIYPSLPDFW